MARTPQSKPKNPQSGQSWSERRAWTKGSSWVCKRDSNKTFDERGDQIWQVQCPAIFATQHCIKDHATLTELNRIISVESCGDVEKESAKAQNSTGGVFDIYPFGIKPLEVYCDTETDEGGWTVFQRRMDGSVDFYRGWNDYVYGFGNKQGEFWLGLENIYQLTKAGAHELRIDMIKTNGIQYFVTYSSFVIGPSSDKYRLSATGYSGNITNRLTYHAGYKFTTKDLDNDVWGGNCAQHRTGAWWYNACIDSNLNGVFGRNDGNGIYWGDSNMKFTEMKFRRKS